MNVVASAHIYFIPKKGSGVFLQDGKDRAHISLLIPAEGEHAGKPELKMSDEAGKVTVSLPASQ